MITWAYIAGFLDGDGWITQMKLKSGRPTYLAGVTQVEIKYKEMLAIHNFLRSHNIKSIFKIRKKNNWKSSLKMVNVTVKEQKSLLKFLSKIKPYLLIKKNLAEEAFNYIKCRLKVRNLKILDSQGKRKWSKKDLESLKSYTNLGMSNVEISHKLGRGTQSVASKICKLNIERKLYVA